MTRKQPVAVLDQAPDGILILLRFARDEHDQVVVRTGTGDSAPQCGGQHRLDPELLRKPLLLGDLADVDIQRYRSLIERLGLRR